MEKTVIDFEEEDFDFEDKWFMDRLEDMVGSELFSEHNKADYVRIGERAWEITIPDIDEDPESQYIVLIEIDAKTISHLD
jgi:hypothetical protein